MAVGKKIFEPDEIRKTIQALKDYEELFEVRCLEANGKRVSSGYFRDVEVMLDQLSRLNSIDSNVYITLNNIKPECYSREQRDRFITNTKVQTSDNDICGYEWLFIDADPKRPAGVSSTDEQLNQAKSIGNKVYVFMKNLGFNEPLTAMSGNGIHLLYKIRLRNSEENKTLIKNCLLVLDMLFSNEF